MPGHSGGACGMISVPSGVKIMVASVPVDFRKGMDGLAALVQEALRSNPFSGDVFVFRAKRLDRVKVLAWDGTGLVLYHNYLVSYCISFGWLRRF